MPPAVTQFNPYDYYTQYLPQYHVDPQSNSFLTLWTAMILSQLTNGNNKDVATSSAQANQQAITELQTTVKEAISKYSQLNDIVIEEKQKGAGRNQRLTELLDVLNEGFKMIQREYHALKTIQTNTSAAVEGVRSGQKASKMALMAGQDEVTTELQEIHTKLDLLADLPGQLDTVTSMLNATQSDLRALMDSVVLKSEVARCPEHYFEAGGECFFLSGANELLTFTQARLVCQNTAGDLALPFDLSALVLALNKDPDLTGDAWVGGKLHTPDPSKNGSWQWLSGAPVDSGWIQGRPSTLQGPQCIALSTQGLGHDLCTAKKRFICKMDVRAKFT